MEETKTVINREERLTEVDNLLRKFWNLESIGIRSSEFSDVLENVRYVVYWPWKGPKVDLNILTNYWLCVARLKDTLESISKELLRQCNEKFQEQLAEEIIEKVTIQSYYT